MDYSFLIVIALIMLSTKVLGLVSEKVNMPQVVGALIAGLLLGPSCFGLIGESDFLVKTAEIGVIILMFNAGLDTDVQELKHTGLSAFIIATIGVIVPFLGGAGCYLLFNGQPDSLRMLKAAFIGVVLTATSVSITVETLREMGKLKSRVGTAIMAAAVIDDVLGIIVLTVLTGFTDSSVEPITIFVRIIAYFICLAIVAVVVRKGFTHLREKIWGVNHRRIAIYALAFCFILSFVSEHFFGIADITGAYFAGLMLSDHNETRTYIVKRINTMSYMLFSPIFFASIGIKTELAGLDGNLILFAITLTVVAIITKIIGCGLGARLTGFKTYDSVSIGLGMVSRGEVALIVAQKGSMAGLISGTMFPAVVLMVIVTTLVTPLLLKVGMKHPTADNTEPGEVSAVGAADAGGATAHV
jgi:Kef-type K+ transport system membrane component KefB